MMVTDVRCWRHVKDVGDQLTLIRGFLGLSPSVISGKKSIIITGDVTDETNQIKIICADRVSVGLFYGINFKWHMPI